MMRTLRSLFIPHKTNTYKPHIIRRHGLALVLAVVFSIQIGSNLGPGKGEVLGIASNINVSALLSNTNAERAAAGLKNLKLSSKLNSSAQSKANHMVNKDYWAHNAPDGTTPWYFFSAAGYSYLGAGENLAYGFDTSAGVVNGWMNSAGHRANILESSYEDVGFGIKNGNNYQGSPNTVVVAHYGDPVKQTATAPTTTSKSSSTPTTTKKTTTKKKETTKKKQVEEEQPESAEQEEVITEEFTPVTNVAAAPKKISNLEAIITGEAHWSLYATTFVLTLVSLVYAYRHILFIHNSIIKGEKFVAHHPLLEASLIYIVLWLLLNGTHGVIY
jgi:hypothetical protein